MQSEIYLSFCEYQLKDYTLNKMKELNFLKGC